MMRLTLLLFVLLIAACKPESPLPVLGNEGHKIPDFEFINQDSLLITNATFDDKIYIADFFFISCPSICPKVKKQMLRIYDRFEGEDDLLFISHTLDPKRDSIPALKLFSNNLEIDSKRWHFVTGEKEDIYDIVDDYFSTATEDPDAPGGFDHSGYILLIDKDRQIRAFANGTDAEDVTDFFKDIEKLLDEHKSAS